MSDTENERELARELAEDLRSLRVEDILIKALVSGGMTERQVDLIRDFGASVASLQLAYAKAAGDEEPDDAA